jgi:hypothetical protein
LPKASSSRGSVVATATDPAAFPTFRGKQPASVHFLPPATGRGIFVAHTKEKQSLYLKSTLHLARTAANLRVFTFRLALFFLLCATVAWVSIGNIRLPLIPLIDELRTAATFSPGWGRRRDSDSWRCSPWAEVNPFRQLRHISPL